MHTRTISGLLATVMLAATSIASDSEPELEQGMQNLPDGLPGESVPYTGARFRRWSPIVSNLDATIHLYTDILGFELGEVTIDPPTSYVFEVFGIDPDIRTRHATFHAGKDKRVLSVVEVPGAKLVRASGSPRMSAALFNANGRFDEIVARLGAEGFEIMSPHKLGEQGIEIGFIDSDGHLYALYEYPYDGVHVFATKE